MRFSWLRGGDGTKALLTGKRKDDVGSLIQARGELEYLILNIPFICAGICTEVCWLSSVDVLGYLGGRGRQAPMILYLA